MAGAGWEQQQQQQPSSAELMSLLSAKLIKAWKQQRVLEAHRILEEMRSVAGSEVAVTAIVRAASMADPDRPANLVPAEVDSQAQQVMHNRRVFIRLDSRSPAPPLPRVGDSRSHMPQSGFLMSLQLMSSLNPCDRPFLDR